MKPMVSPIPLGTRICIGLVLTCCGLTNARAQDAFKDVPSSNWAYNAITDFQRNSILVGYPNGFFNGKRVLTRYEFAMAIKRAIDNILFPSIKNSLSVGASPETKLLPDQVRTFERLVDEFSKDLKSLQVNVPQVKQRLEAMEINIHPAASHPDPIAGAHSAAPLSQSMVSNESPGLRVTLPLLNSGTIGGSLLNSSGPTGISAPTNDVVVGGINVNLNPIGKLNVSADLSRPFTQLYPGRADGEASSEAENSAFNLNVRYGSGPIGILGGYQYVDPGYDAPGAWNRIGMLSNLTNVEGPFLRLNYNVNARTQFQIGSDLLSGAHNRTYNFGGGVTTGFGTHDYISKLSAGMEYKLWNFTSLTADWEGLYWDLSSASSGIAGEAHPFESYINLGTGFRLRGNAMLKMGYQIGSFGNLSGLSGLGPSGSGQTYNAFTTQLNVKF